MVEYGISSIGTAIPSYAFPLTDFAVIRGLPSTHYTESLGCKTMSLCAADESVVSLAVKAAQRALDNWGQDKQKIGLLVVASETGVDMSRPLSSWVMSGLNLHGAVRSYEVKHACYAGTAAIRQALEWKLSGNSQGKAALVIAADVALYAPGHSGEPTQGAGAIALIIDKPNIAAIDPISYYWSDPQFDFWRPVGQAYPEANGRLSLSCYVNAVVECFKQLNANATTELGYYLDEFKYLCFHVPFPKMVHKAFKRLGELCSWDSEKTQNQYGTKVYPTMEWNQQLGNSYTASLWFSIGNALTKLQTNEQFLAFSYGSGCGAELLNLQCKANQKDAAWVQQLQADLSQRQTISAAQYQAIRENK